MPRSHTVFLLTPPRPPPAMAELVESWDSSGRTEPLHPGGRATPLRESNPLSSTPSVDISPEQNRRRPALAGNRRGWGAKGVSWFYSPPHGMLGLYVVAWDPLTCAVSNDKSWAKLSDAADVVSTGP